MQALPTSFTRTISATFGAEGRAWLAELPARLGVYKSRWGLTLLPPFSLSYHYVAPAVRAGGEPCVLKLGVPRPELSREIAALGLYGGHGAVRLLDADPEGGALLLERLLPGRSLADDWTGDLASDEAATRVAARVMRGLWRPAPAGAFLPLAGWAGQLADLRAHFGGGTGPLPERLVERAEGSFAELLGSSPPLLLHGDLHHGNILSAHRSRPASSGFIAIDPKGVVGDAGYEVGAFLRNPTPRVAAHPDLERLLARRLAVFSEELEVDARVLAAWGLAHAVLSAWWDLGDAGEEGGAGDGWRPAVRCAAALSELSP